MATRVNKAAGISSSLTMTYLFFIFRAIANHVSLSLLFCTVATAAAAHLKAAARSAKIYVSETSGRTPTEREIA